MLNEERVKLMTRLASFEHNEGKKDRNLSKYFRSDYVGLEVLKAIICGTLAYMICFGVYIYYNFETLMLDIYKIDLLEFGGTVLKKYLVFIVIYCCLVFLGFTYKYSKAKHGLKLYFNNLKKLHAMLNREREEERTAANLEKL